MDDNRTILTRDAFLSNSHLKRELVDVPELGGAIYLRELTSAQLLDFQARVERMKQAGEITTLQSFEIIATLVSYSACDENGTLLFREEDVPKLAQGKISLLNILANKVMEISGIDMAGNLTATLKKNQNNTSPSNSRKNSKRRKRTS